VISGKRDQLAGKIQELYGITKEEVESQLSAWQKTCNKDERKDSNVKPIRENV